MDQSPTADRPVSLEEAIAIAVHLHQSGQKKAAGEIYRTILEVAPVCAPALHFSGVLAHQEGRSDEAVVLITKSLEIEPNRADWHSNLGIVLRDQLKLDEAVAACERAIAIDPEHANALSNLGVLLRATGREAEAEAAYRAAIRADPRHIEAHHNLGVLLNSLNRTPEAVACFYRVITLQPNEPEARRLLALAYCNLGEVDKAVDLVEAWVKEQPDNPVARHIYSAVSGRDVPKRASDQYVELTFDSFAATFEAKLARLSYRAPALVASMLDDSGLSPSKNLDVLDAGCGTGLCGAHLVPYARRLTGVDISAGMLKQAKDKNIYDELYKAELTQYLSDHREAYDVIVSADTLCYFGDLHDVLTAAANALRPNGRLIFTVERATDETGVDHRIEKHGRYSHSSGYIERLISGAGLVPEIRPAELRLESALPVAGLVVRGTKTPDAPAIGGHDA